MVSYSALRSIAPETLLSDFRDTILATYLVGSRAYGTSTPSSDEDYRGIFVLPRDAYLSISEPVCQIADGRHNTTYFALKRFMELAAGANPNIIEMLYMPGDCRVYESPIMQKLLDNRSIFISKQAFASHINYATSQIKRAKGQNKFVNNPQPEEKPSEIDFCWFVPIQAGLDQFPYRPIALKDTGISLSRCSCAAMEHLTNAYRLYEYDSPTRGVFRNGTIVCDSIPKSDEVTRCVGLLIYNREHHERAMRDHKNYWDWRQNRNDSRWQSQQRGELDYDPKNMMHTYRLLLSGESIIKHGAPIVRFEGDQLRTLMRIRECQFSYDELIAMVDDKHREMADAMMHCQLPEYADRNQIDHLLADITAEWERTNGYGQCEAN